MKFRRKSDVDAAPEAVDESGSPDTESGPTGPYDVDDLPDDGVERVDLGSLVIAPEADRELRLQVDEKSGNVQAVVLAGPDGALELRAFAAPRGGDLWGEVRPQIAADMSRRGGTATEREGEFGPELVCQITVKRPDGTTGTQPSRIIGVNGPRWLLRATLLGRPALEPEAAGAWIEALRRVAVRRGAHALPVGEALPLVMPENARRVDPPTP
ncbi:DUF3710 domain-containing protein [Nocardioides sp. cx-169]|uniref:DUF3710 domain-containing protein n=1 Tax=Nocardioides sp. cx-169 TaxID=2899080 RepID=UPI001E58351D|nr:DUF3710 domain-containing protein [Nocardioides sp. cx-169]MCD4534888.1 DUF3710 domain-containing protein [Nocardioides sp. cx-169]